MSYLHCPSCKRAYNLLTDRTCPSCPVAASVVDPAEDIVAAAEQLSRAMARATPNERADAMGRMDRLALPAPNAKPVTFHGGMLRTIREALDPPPPPRARKQTLLGMVATKVAARIAPAVERLAPHLELLAPHIERLSPRARELGSGLRARMRALAA